MFLVVPEIVAVLPNVTVVALALIVRLAFGLPPLGGFAATAGPAQTSTAASAAPIFFIPHKRSRMPRVGDRKRRGARRRLFVSLLRRQAQSNPNLRSRSWPALWATCTRTPPRRRKACRAPSCAGPR